MVSMGLSFGISKLHSLDTVGFKTIKKDFKILKYKDPLIYTLFLRIRIKEEQWKLESSFSTHYKMAAHEKFRIWF